MAEKRLARWAAALALAACVLAPVAAAVAGDATSGIPVGGGTPAFQVQDVTGRFKGGKVCYVWKNGGRPSFLVFARALDGRLASLAKAIDQSVAQSKDKRTGFFVLLDDNTPENRDKVAAFAKQHDVSLPMTVAVNGAKGPGSYKLNPDIPITVLIYKGKKVKANVALAAPAPSDEKAQAKEVADIIAAADQAFK